MGAISTPLWATATTRSADLPGYGRWLRKQCGDTRAQMPDQIELVVIAVAFQYRLVDAQDCPSPPGQRNGHVRETAMSEKRRLRRCGGWALPPLAPSRVGSACRYGNGLRNAVRPTRLKVLWAGWGQRVATRWPICDGTQWSHHRTYTSSTCRCAQHVAMGMGYGTQGSHPAQRKRLSLGRVGGQHAAYGEAVRSHHPAAHMSSTCRCGRRRRPR